MADNEVKKEEKGDNKGPNNESGGEGKEEQKPESGEVSHRGGEEHKERDAEAPQAPQITVEELGSTLKQATEIIMAQSKQIQDMQEKLAAFNVQEFKDLSNKVNDMVDKMPKVIKDDKATISGYYDFEHKTKRLVNEASERDRREAQEAFNFLNKPL